jgi:hypothetical protein
MIKSKETKFIQVMNQMSLDSKMGLKQDLPTRWNFTYLILMSTIHYRLTFSYLEMIEPSFKHCPTPLEWENMKNINSFLCSFYTATCQFFGTKYSIANLCFPVVSSILYILKGKIYE